MLKSCNYLSTKTRLIIILLSAVMLLSSALYLHLEWRKFQNIASSEAVQLSESLQSLLHIEHIAALSGDDEDLNNPNYELTKNSLRGLVVASKNIQSAYLYKQIDGKIAVLVDSELPDTENYSSPGQIYTDADGWYIEPLRTGTTTITKTVSNRFGNSISALVPIKDDNNIIAVFALDFSASDWNAAVLSKITLSFVVLLVIIMLFLSLVYILIQHSKLKKLNEKLTVEETFYRTIFEQAPIGIAIMEDKAHAVKTKFADLTINSKYQKILGRSKEELQSISWPEITHKDDLENDFEKFARFKKGETKNYSHQKRFVKPDGSIVWTNIHISTLEGLNEKHSFHLSLIEDITEQKHTEDALKEKKKRETVILSYLPGMAYRCKYDRDWTIEYVSDGCFQLTGYTSLSLLNNRAVSFNDIISEEYRELLWDEWARVIQEKLPFKYEYELITASGERKWVMEMGQVAYNDKGEVEALEGIILDISDRKQLEDNLKYNNEHDRLTGLYNRYYLESFIAKEIKENIDSNRALMSVNLSTVQLLTTKYGFHYTQKTIKKAAEQLKLICNDNIILFKTYENRFVFFIKNYKSREELTNIAENVAESLETVLADERIGGGIGILEINECDDKSIDSILRKLLIASEKAINIFYKDFRFCFFDTELEAGINRETEIVQILSAMIADESQDQFYLQFQPIVDAKTNAICGFEALARLTTQKFGQISPLEFIPIAEKTKLIVPLGDKIIIKALTFLNKLNKEGYSTVSVSINISAIQLLRPGFSESFLDMVDKMGANPKNICIELTESVFSSDYETINNIITKLKEAGIQFAIDDFGTGYSSLAKEKELNVDCLKVDKFFIDKLLKADNKRSITSDIISIAHKLGHCAVAEGVEHKEQLQYLKENGCDKIQGYLISKPLDEDMAMKFIKNHNK